MALHFTRDELAARMRSLCDVMREKNLDAMLLFRQESMYWLTGFDTFGFVFFQSLVVTVDGRMALLTRAPDLRQAENTSIIEDIHIWVDREDASPADDLRQILQGVGLAGGRIGVEYEAYGLTGRNALRVNATLEKFALLQDESDLISRLRLVKSPAEMDYLRQAGSLADAALQAGLPLIHGGSDEAAILAAMQAAVLAGGGDYPANEFVIGSGPDALLCRYFSGRRRLDADDQLTIEWAGVYRHYHAAMMRTFPIGKASPAHCHMHAACTEALEAGIDAFRSGNAVGMVFDAQAAVLDSHGYADSRLNACGYAMGTTFAPNWMDWPMFYTGNPVVLAPGMAFFFHMIVMDSATGEAMTLGESLLLNEKGPERLSQSSRDLYVG